MHPGRCSRRGHHAGDGWRRVPRRQPGPPVVAAGTSTGAPCGPRSAAVRKATGRHGRGQDLHGLTTRAAAGVHPGRCSRQAHHAGHDRPRCGRYPGDTAAGRTSTRSPRGRLPTCILVDALDRRTTRATIGPGGPSTWPPRGRLSTCILVDALDRRTMRATIGRGAEGDRATRPRAGSPRAHHTAGYRRASWSMLSTWPPRGPRSAAGVPRRQPGPPVVAAGTSTGAPCGPRSAAVRKATGRHGRGQDLHGLTTRAAAGVHPGRCSRQAHHAGHDRPRCGRGPGDTAAGRPSTWPPRGRLPACIPVDALDRRTTRATIGPDGPSTWPPRGRLSTCILVDALDRRTTRATIGRGAEGNRATRPRAGPRPAHHAAGCQRASWSMLSTWPPRGPRSAAGRTSTSSPRGRLPACILVDALDVATTRATVGAGFHVGNLVPRSLRPEPRQAHHAGHDRPRCGRQPGDTAAGRISTGSPRGRLPACILVDALDRRTTRATIGPGRPLTWPACRRRPVPGSTSATWSPGRCGRNLDRRTMRATIGRGAEGTRATRPRAGPRRAHHAAGCRRASWSMLSTGAPRGPRSARAGPRRGHHAGGCQRASWSMLSTGAPCGPRSAAVRKGTGRHGRGQDLHGLTTRPATDVHPGRCSRRGHHAGHDRPRGFHVGSLVPRSLRPGTSTGAPGGRLPTCILVDALDRRTTRATIGAVRKGTGQHGRGQDLHRRTTRPVVNVHPGRCSRRGHHAGHDRPRVGPRQAHHAGGCRRASWSMPSTWPPCRRRPAPGSTSATWSPGRCAGTSTGSPRGPRSAAVRKATGRHGRGQDLHGLTTRPVVNVHPGRCSRRGHHAGDGRRRVPRRQPGPLVVAAGTSTSSPRGRLPACILVDALDRRTTRATIGRGAEGNRATRPRVGPRQAHHAAGCRRASWSMPSTGARCGPRSVAVRKATGRHGRGQALDVATTRAAAGVHPGRCSRRAHDAGHDRPRAGPRQAHHAGGCRRASWSMLSTGARCGPRSAAVREGDRATRPRAGPRRGHHAGGCRRASRSMLSTGAPRGPRSARTGPRRGHHAGGCQRASWSMLLTGAPRGPRSAAVRKGTGRHGRGQDLDQLTTRPVVNVHPGRCSRRGHHAGHDRPRAGPRQAHHAGGCRRASWSMLSTWPPRGRRLAPGSTSATWSPGRCGRNLDRRTMRATIGRGAEGNRATRPRAGSPRAHHAGGCRRASWSMLSTGARRGPRSARAGP